MIELGQLTDDEIRETERQLATQKWEREFAKWDAELVGRYFRIIREPREDWFIAPTRLARQDDHVTLARSLAVGQGCEDYVYADVVYLHIQRRSERELTCSGFQVSHTDRREPYLKIQPIFYSYSDFRGYFNQWETRSGPPKYFDEISKDDYVAALTKTVNNFIEGFTQ